MSTDARLNTRRRRLVTAAALALGAPAVVRAQSGPKIRIGYWPVAAGLPFFAAVEKGYFKEAGLEVEALKFAGAQQVMEAMLSGRSSTPSYTRPLSRSTSIARSTAPSRCSAASDANLS